jgi:hypothetical protein
MDENLQKDVLIFLEVKVDADEFEQITVEQIIDAIDTQEINSFLKYTFK